MPIGAILGAVTAVGSIGGALAQGSATKKAQNRGASLQNQGLDALQSAQNDLLGSDPYKAFTSLLSQFSTNPNTYTPELIASIKGRASDAAQQGYGEAMNAAWDRAGAQGAYRDGSTRAGESRLGQQLGGRLADISRQVDEDAAKQRIADLAQFGSLLQGFFNLRSGPAQAYANAAIGVGTQQANYNASPFGDAAKGIGTLGMAIGSAPQPYKYDSSGKITGGGGTLFGSMF